jgi:hypothetical protein
MTDPIQFNLFDQKKKTGRPRGEGVRKRSVAVPIDLDEQVVSLGGKYSNHVAEALKLYLKGKNK